MGTGTLTIGLSPGLRKSSALIRRSTGFLERASASLHMAKSITAFVMNLDIRPILSSIQVPMLAVHRADEAIDVSYGRELAEGVPNGRLVVLEGDDHLRWVGNTTEYVDTIEEFLTGSKHQVEPQRGLSTVLFTDIVSSTSQNAELGDDAWRRLLDQHNAFVRGALADHRGREIKTIGDGFLSTFDGPARALRCAKTIVDGVGDLGLSVRAGLHTGEVELYPDGDIGGMAVNLGARVERQRRAARCWCRRPSRTSCSGQASDSSRAGSTSSRVFPARGPCSHWRARAATTCFPPWRPTITSGPSTRPACDSPGATPARAGPYPV